MVQVIDDPATAYRRVALDARVEGSDGAELTRLCLEQALAEIARARGEGQGIALLIAVAIGYAGYGRHGSEPLPVPLQVHAWSALLAYVRVALQHEPREQFRVLYLDKKNQLILDEVQNRGTVDHAPVYPREVVRRALELSSSAIILVHNHPSGDPAPSRADITMTQQIVEIAKPLGILVHDHIIVGKNKHASFKELRLI